MAQVRESGEEYPSGDKARLLTKCKGEEGNDLTIKGELHRGDLDDALGRNAELVLLSSSDFLLPLVCSIMYVSS